MMPKYQPGKDNFLSRENKRLERENKQLQSQLAEAERERDEALSKKVSDIIKEFALGEEFKSPSVVFQMAMDIDRLNRDKRHEWVRAINAAGRFGLNRASDIGSFLIDPADLKLYAKRIESGGEDVA